MLPIVTKLSQSVRMYRASEYGRRKWMWVRLHFPVTLSRTVAVVGTDFRYANEGSGTAYRGCYL